MGATAAPSRSIVDLRGRPDFAPVVADRVWRAWWEPKGYGLATVEALVRRNLDDRAIPLALVAHADGTFLGTASVIACDLDARPRYTPWIAAVWVDPAYRSDGIGAGLVRAGAETARGLGFDAAYLCALPSRRGFYERLGWARIEEGVTDAGLDVFRSP